MKFTTTLLALVLFGIVTFFYLDQLEKDKIEKEEQMIKKQEQQFQIEEKAFRLEKGDRINFIQVQDLKGDMQTYWLRLDEGKWFLEYPVTYPANGLIVEGIERSLKLALNQEMFEREAEWSDYGLAEPDLKIGFSTQKHEERHFILLGGENPVGDSIFAKWEDGNAYFLLPKGIKSAFQKSTYALREKRTFRAPISQMKRVFVELGQRTYDWVQRDGKWYWMEPIAFLGREVGVERMNAILHAVSTLYIREFLNDSNKTPFDYGISMIADRIKVESEDGDSEVIFLGEELMDKNAYYAVRENEETIFLLDQVKVLEFLDLLKAVEISSLPEEQLEELKRRAEIAQKQQAALEDRKAKEEKKRAEPKKVDFSELYTG